MTAGDGAGSAKGRGGPITVEGYVAPGHGVQLPPREGAVAPGSAVPPPVKVIEMEEELAARQRRALRVVAGVLLAAALLLAAVWVRSLLR